MKCPNEEQLMLYVDGELEGKESLSIASHIVSCQKCQSIVNDFKADAELESMLRQKVVSSFEKHKVSSKIMKSVMAEPRHNVKKSSTNSWLEKLIVRLLLPALALAIALFVVFGGASDNQGEQVYTGKAYKISVFTNNANSFADSKELRENQSFLLESDEMRVLEGNFLVNVVTNGNTYSLLVEGKTAIKFDENKMFLRFDDCTAKISIVNGNFAELMINGENVKVTQREPFEISKEDIIEPSPSQVKNESNELEKVQSEVKTEEPKNIEEKMEPDVSVDACLEEDVYVPIEKEEETLTQEATDGIVIINISSESVDVNYPSPFGNGSLGGL